MSTVKRQQHSIILAKIKSWMGPEQCFSNVSCLEMLREIETSVPINIGIKVATRNDSEVQ